MDHELISNSEGDTGNNTPTAHHNNASQTLAPDSGGSIAANIGESAKNISVGHDITQTRVEGNVDIQGGDFVGRDKVTIGSIVTNLFARTPDDVRRLRNRQAMLKLVKNIWVKGVLEQSLYNEVLLDLGMEERPEAVKRPWAMILEVPEQASRRLPQGTKIVHVFDEMNHSLLILGEPGSGKTTMLLELARDMIARAEQDETEPIPVVFNLSAWADKRHPINQWLVDELRTKYNIPKPVAQAWVEDDALLLLLDGLDEVRQDQRDECVSALNQFQENRKVLAPLAICSRTTEYATMANKLKLQGAVVLQPLTAEQIDAFFARAGDKLLAVHELLQHDTILRALTQSPLMLSITSVAYQHQSIAEIQPLDSVELCRKHLFDTYIDRILKRKAKTAIDLYPRTQTLRWLSRLARCMLHHSQTVFLIERLQPSWLQAIDREVFPIYAIMLLWGPIYGLVVGLLLGLGNGLVEVLIFGQISGQISWLSSGLINWLTYGLMVGTLAGLLDGLSGGFREIRSSQQSNWPWQRLKSSLYSACFWGLSGGLIVGLGGERIHRLIFWLIDKPISWLIDRLILAIFFGLLGGLVGGFRQIKPVERASRPRKQLRRNLVSGLQFGLILTLILGLIYGFRYGLSGRLLDGLMFGLRMSLTFGLLFGLVGLMFGLLFEPDTGLDRLNSGGTQTPNHNIRLAAQHALLAGLMVLIFASILRLSIAPSDGLIAERNDWMSLRFGHGLLHIGLDLVAIGGVFVGLIGGGDIVVKHWIVRFALYLRGYAPWNYARFLDYCADRIFLRKVGGGYIFIHRLLLEHFAALDEEDIKRLSGSG